MGNGIAITALTIALVVVGTITGWLLEDRYLSGSVDRSYSLSAENLHQPGIDELNRIKSRWSVKYLDLREIEIQSALDKIGIRKEHLAIFQNAMNKMGVKEYEEAIIQLTTVPESSFYFQLSQTNIETGRKELLKISLEKEVKVRQVLEESLRISELNTFAERVAKEEQQSARKVAEQESEFQRLAKEQQTAARREAEEETESQRLAKEQQAAARREAEKEVERQRLAKEQQAVARREAEEEAERQRLAKEQQAVARREAEEEAERQRLAKEQQAAARREAEEEAERQRLAKELQQIEAENQKLRAIQEERTKVLELAKTHPTIKAIVTGELNFYIDPLPSYAGPNVEVAVADISIAFSSSDLYGAVVRRVYSRDQSDLTISWIRDYGSHTIGESIYKSHIKVGLGQVNCLGEWMPFTSDTVKKILWHELGHSMGYGHSNDPQNIMYFTTDTRFAVEHEISEVLPGGWYRTIPLCRATSYWYSLESGDDNTGFTLLVLPPGVDPESIGLGTGSVYPSCGAENMIRYSNSCSVPANASIYISNASYVSIPINGRVIDQTPVDWSVMEWDSRVYEYSAAELESYWILFN